jgi:hypothetical protein
MVDELAVANNAALTDLEQTAKPKVAVLNRPELVHFAAILGSSDSVIQLLLQAVESPLAEKHFPLSGIWRTYAVAVVNLHRGIRTETTLPKAKGYEKYYLPYVRYMNAANAQEQENAQIEVAQSFEARNRDSRFIDWYGLDGDAKKPVRWDFRQCAIDASRTKRREC